MDKIKVLVIDDEKVVLMAMKKILEKHGFLVDCVNSPTDFIKNLKNDGYKYYFLDYILTELDGIEVYKKLKELSPEAKVVFITGSINTNEIVNRAKEITPNEEINFIYKPDLNEKTILEIIKKLS